MSLIALTLNNCYDEAISPILIGDLLITSENGKTNLSLPTFINGVKELVPDNQYLPTNILQKIYVIENQFIIGLAGLVSEMKLVLIAFKEFIKYEKIRNESLKTNFKKEIILEFYKEVEKTELIECSFCLGYAGLDSNFYFITHGNWFEGNTQNFGYITATGSGAQEFFNIANENQYPDSIEESGKMNAIVKNHINIFGHMISLEKVTLQTIKNYWGVNYEMIMLSKNNFSKANNVTHLIASVYIDLLNDERIVQPLFIYNSIYFEELLLIRALDIKESILNGFIVYPIDYNRDLIYNNLPPVEIFKAGNLSVTYFFSFSNGETIQQTFYLVNYTTEDGKPLSHRVGIKENGDIEIIINPAIENAIFTSAIKAVLDNDKICNLEVSAILGNGDF